MQANNSLRNNNQHACLKVSDFYSVHLTTYFLSTTDSGVAGPQTTARKYDQFCDRIPGGGFAVFAIDLMEQDARKLEVALSFSQYDSQGRLKLVKQLPPNLHPRGTLTLDAPIQERGNIF
jgi:hypothetical protein